MDRRIGNRYTAADDSTCKNKNANRFHDTSSFSSDDIQFNHYPYGIVGTPYQYYSLFFGLPAISALGYMMGIMFCNDSRNTCYASFLYPSTLSVNPDPPPIFDKLIISVFRATFSR